MSTQPESTLISTPPPASTRLAGLETGSDRRADIDAKMAMVAEILKQSGCVGLLLLKPENVSWMTSGSTTRGVLDPQDAPCVYCTGEARWILCGNVDTDRIFDEEVTELGFQLKEWPWHWGRHQLLAELCQGRQVASDSPLPDCVVVEEALRKVRRGLTPYEQACIGALGATVAHAVEATCRTMEAGLSEREMAGMVAHRMLHRGVKPVQVSVAVDGRSRQYRNHGYTAAVMQRYAVITATGRKYGLNVTASRCVSFGQPEEEVRKEHNAVCKVSATYQASTWPDAVPREILLAGRRIYLLSGFEHEWSLAPQGFVTGRASVELPLLPTTEDLFEAGWVVTWTPCAGAVRGCDSYLITDQGPRVLTPTETWPVKRIRVQGAEFIHPDILIR